MSLQGAVDHDMCIGYAECTRVAPNAFRLNDANQSEVIPGATGVTDEDLMAAARECPANAIRLLPREDETIDSSGTGP